MRQINSNEMATCDAYIRNVDKNKCISVIVNMLWVASALMISLNLICEHKRYHLYCMAFHTKNKKTKLNLYVCFYGM